VLVRLTLEVGYSTCRKGHDADVASCQLKSDSVMMMMMCLVMVLFNSLVCDFFSWISSQGKAARM
jgi:hypothetical protein